MNVLDSIKNEIIKIMDNDPAHDFDHVMRVYTNAKKIVKEEKADEKLVLSAALLHDIVSYPKSSKRSKFSSIDSAKKSKLILQKYDFTTEEITIISDAIADHSFSQNKIPQTLEGKILQDADRLDALGAIGIARVFAYLMGDNIEMTDKAGEYYPIGTVYQPHEAPLPLSPEVLQTLATALAKANGKETVPLDELVVQPMNALQRTLSNVARFLTQ